MNKTENKIKDRAVEVGKIKGLEYWISPATFENALNGYVFYPKRPVRETGYDGIISYVPVHGGITYADSYKGGIIYGFDTLHCDSDKFPRTDKAWIKSQIEVIISGIEIAKKVELKYLKALTNRTKAKYADMVLNVQREQGNNFRVCLNLLSGNL